MLKYFNSKIYRKLLILSVFVAATLVVSSNRTVSAVPCCDACYGALSSCIGTCNNGQIKDWMIPACELQCNVDFQYCAQFCETEPGIFGCP